ncbi:MAG: hypothetical protein GY810_04445 [Aureispira sp.]|nr:hypothetical protein [Aureispira sp.]
MGKTAIIGFMIGIVGVMSCNESTNTPKNPETTTVDTTSETLDTTATTKKELPDPELVNKYLVTEDGLLNIKIGDSAKQHEKYLKKAVQENGEGSFPGYDLLDENQEKIGFVFSENDENTYKEGDLIGYMEIYSPLYKTEEGIGVNSTFADLKNTYPNAETHGSEIEGWTNTNIGGLAFRLDTHFHTYKIDESKIKPSTKVTQIGVWGAKDK